MAEKENIKIISENRKAWHNYFIDEKMEAGIVLTGTEVKSLRDGKANLQDAYAIFSRGELFLLNAHIGAYAMGNRQNHEPLRTRKLLLHHEELNKLRGRVEIKGNSLIPLKLYFKKGLVKVELGLGRGKKMHDKRESTKDREAKRSLEMLRKKASR
jgi:SsrA-binding protein